MTLAAMGLTLGLVLQGDGQPQVAQGRTPPRDQRAPPALGTSTITGLVVTDDVQARPLRRARVTVNGPALEIGRTVVTADDGTFTIGGLPAGSYTLSAAKEAYVTMAYGATRAGVVGAPLALAAGGTARVTMRVPRGAVISGTILDADGQPAQGISVSALRRRYVSGGIRYAPAGTPALPTDDRGAYRIYGLPAGEYVVVARPGDVNGPNAVFSRPVRPMQRESAGRGDVVMAEIFHPSATDPSSASRIDVRTGDERSGVDVQLQYLPLASVSGTVALAAGWSRPEVAIARAVDESIGTTAVQTTTADAAGRFSLVSLTPGRYRVVARSIRGGAIALASADVSIDGEDVSELTLSAQPALTISGPIVFRGDRPPPVFGTSTSTPAPIAMLLGLNGAPMPPLQIDGRRFTIGGFAPGRYRLGSNLFGLQRPIGAWWLQSIAANGVELLDAPLDLTQSVDGAVAVFSDRASEVSGRVTAGDGTPVASGFVVAFSTDRSTWFFGSRRIAGVTPDRDGRYTIPNLPPGDYHLVASGDLDAGDWFDPAVLDRLLPAATPLTIRGTEQTIVDLAVK